jgi:hypothetical protein
VAILLLAFLACGASARAFGTGDGSEWRAPMGIISIGGLLTSTFLTLLVVPVVYTLLDDAARSLRPVRARISGPSRAAGAERPPLPGGEEAISPAAGIPGG